MRLQSQGVRVTTTLLWGMAAAAIIDFARGTEGSMVVMSTRGRSGMQRWVQGSVTDKVVRGSEGPVLVIPPGQE